jgi:hypothetical protein
MDNLLKGKIGEAFVNELAENTFLNYWCFPNPHDEQGNKKEICDLLILFKNVCIICQIKNYEFKENHERYYRKTVDSGAKQIQGAERKLFHIDRDIYIKNEKQGLIKFQRDKYSEIIRIIIHLGEGMQYQNLGRLTETNRDYIHILGKEDINFLLQELNTIADLVEYLNSRESLTTKIEKTIFAGKEKDLLGLYLRIKPHFDKFIKDNEGKILLVDLENSWEDYEREKANSENEDLLREIEDLIYYWVDTDLIKNKESREVAEEMMSLNRYERRYFAAGLLNFIDSYSNKNYKQIIRRNTTLNKIGFVFFYYPSNYKEEQLQQLMLIAADGYGLYLKYEITNFIVIGINEHEKIKFLHVNLENMKDKPTDDLKKALDYLGWFQEENMQFMEIDFNKKTKNSS